MLPDVDGTLPILVLAPSAEETPDSSLSHMFAVMLERRGAAGSGFFVQAGALQTDARKGFRSLCFQLIVNTDMKQGCLGRHGWSSS